MGGRRAKLGVLSLKEDTGKGALGRHLGWEGGDRSTQGGQELLKSLAKKQKGGQHTRDRPTLRLCPCLGA